MIISELLAHLSKLNVKLWAEGDQLRYTAPKGALTPTLRAELVAHKADLLALLDRNDGVARATSPSIPCVARDGELRLSFAQQRLWFLDQLMPNSPVYNIPLAVRLLGKLDAAALANSLRAVMQRHETLRTTFRMAEQHPIQVVASRPTLRLSVLDLQALPAATQAATLRRLAEYEARQPFDLTLGPLLRATLLRRSATEHGLFLTLHHIIADGWSMEVLVRELALLYAAHRARLPNPLPPLPIQYADYAAWQRQWLQGAVLERQVAYWRTQLADAPGLLELPTDYPRPKHQSFHGDHVVAILPNTLCDALTALSRGFDGTLFMTLLAAFQVLLARYSGQDDIVVGTPIANRTRSETKGLIGFFVNTLVLRTNLAGAPTVQALLQRVRTIAFDAYAHQDLPFEHLVEELHPDRELNRHPLFQVSFTLQNTPSVVLDAPDLRMEPLAVAGVTAKFDLSVAMVETPQGLVTRWEYSTDLFDATTIARMAGHFQILLGGIVADATRRITDLPLLTDAERWQLLVDWNATAQVYPHDQCIHDLFTAQAAHTPDAIAVVFDAASDDHEQPPSNSGIRDTQHLSYAELDRRANQLAHHLRTLGLGPETLVAICMHRAPAFVVALLGTLKAGAAYLPLDPTYPTERLHFMLQDSGAAVLITVPNDASDDKLTSWHAEKEADNLLATFSPCQAVVDLAKDWPTIARQPCQPPSVALSLDNLAYLIYTSGSSGIPKGVATSHAGIAALAAAQIDAFGLSVGSRVLQFASVSFDGALSDYVMALLSGATLVLAPQQTALLGTALLDLLRQQAITTLKLPPSLLAALPATNLPALRTLIAGGESCPAALVARWGVVRQFVNAYGPSEATVCTTMHSCTLSQQPPPIGRPIADKRVYVLDERMQPVPVGVAGELHIGGPCLARGYHRRPDLTAERFVPNPFVDDKETRRQAEGETVQAPIQNRVPRRGESKIQNGTRLYKTGDRARYYPDGTLEFLGRLDHQVKIRGFRIELGEIAAVLEQHAAVQEAVVVVRADGGDDKRLVGYVVLRTEDRRLKIEDSSADSSEALSSVLYPVSSELRDFLAQRLPDYMVPAAFAVLDALPLTANGKLDRAALPAPELPTAATIDQAPRRPTEELLATMWSEVLHLGRVDLMDNFFVLGGHSLLATQLVARIRETFAIELSVRNLFERPTVAALAEYVETVQRTAHGLSLPPLLPMPRTDLMPLSFAQQRLWFLDQFAPGSITYSIPTAVRVQGTLHLPALAQSFGTVIQRHETLRTTFATVEGVPFQVIAPQVPLPLCVTDLTGLPLDQRELVAHRLATTEAQQPFDLTRGPLLRIVLLRHALDDHTLLLTMHHIVSDAWSIGILIRELAEGYATYRIGQAALLPPLPIQYADYALWQRQWFQDAVLETHLAYWRAQLADAPPVLELPTDRPRPTRQSFRGDQERFQLSAALRDELHTLSCQNNATLFMTLLAVFQVLLARYSGQDIIVVGSPIANRTQQATEGLIGFFVNTLVLRTDLSGNPSFRDLIAGVRRLTLDAYIHQDVPFEKLVEELQPERDLSHTPLFQVLFVFQNAPLQRVELPDLTLQPQARVTATAKFDLTLALSEAAEGLVGAWEYSTDLFDAATITRMVGQYQTVLAGILADPTRRIADLPLLTDMERQQLLVEWNASQSVEFQHNCLHQLFEAQVARTPDAVAVICEGQQLTYQSLNTRTNQLARTLRGLGVGPDTLVALSVERSLDLVIGILGVHKAGGAYVPIDPSYPSERISFMLEDSGAALVIVASNTSSAKETRSQADKETGAASDLILSPPHLVTWSRRVVDLHADWPSIARQPRTDLPLTGEPGHLAYVIYTSGSTGTPKGVMVSHANVVRLFAATEAWFEFNTDQVWTLFHSYAFDFSVWEIWGALLYGGRLVVVPYWVSRAPDAFYNLLGRERVTVLNQTPSAFGQLLQVEAGLEQAPPLALRWIIFGGEALVLSRLQPWFERHDDQVPQVVNMYGITETTVHVTYRPLCAADLHGAAGSMIGERIPDLQLYVLNRQLQPVPIGVPGELYIGGAGLARGYFNRPDLTAERFVPNPFAEVSGARYRVSEVGVSDTRYLAPDTRLYKTGDLARYLPNGELEYVGRKDGQVKIRGFRIEAGEIEAVLLQHPAIQEAVVLVQQQANDTPSLVAYLVIQPPAPTLTDLRRFLQARLPEYMLPAAFVLRESLPLTANGKLDLRALTTSGTETKLSLGAAYAPPCTEIETLLVNAWQKVLGVTPIGIHDNYFALGGDSIRVIQMLQEIKQYHLSATVLDLFQHQTIAQLAHHLSKSQRKTENALPMELVRIPEHIYELLPDDCDDAYPAARMQELMLFHYANNAQNTGIYHVQQSFHIHSADFSLETLNRALVLMVQKHVILRTVFFTEHVRRPIQIVKKAMAFSIAVNDIRNVSMPAQEEYIHAAMQQDRIDLFNSNDLDTPLFRFKVFLRSEETFEFLMSIHHALDDGWGNVEFLKELVDVYLSLKSGEDVVIVPPANTYKEFVALEQAQIASDEAFLFWNTHVCKYKHQPLQQRRSWCLDTSDGNQRHMFDSELTSGLQQLSQRLGCSLKAIFLSAYLDLIQGVSGADVISAGVVVSGRSARLTDPLKALGLFWNIIPLCYHIDDGDKCTQVQNVQQLLIDIEPYANYPLLELLEQRREAELFFATFNFLHFHNLKTITQNEDVHILQSRGHDRFHFPLNTTISVNPFDSEVMMRIEYDSRYFSRDSITAMVRTYADLLKCLLRTEI